MRYVNLLLVLLLLNSCQNRNQENPVAEQIEEEESPTADVDSYVTITVPDTVSSSFLQVYYDRFQERPEILNLGELHGRNSISIPAEQLRLVGGVPGHYTYDKGFSKGDTVLVSKRQVRINDSDLDYPYFELKNRTEYPDTLNFQFLLFRKNIESGALKTEPDSNPLLGVERDNKQIYENALNILDSLKENSKIPEEYYTAKKKDLKLEYHTSRMFKARRDKKVFDEDVTEIGPGLQDDFLNKNYIRYVRTLVEYQHFPEEQRVAASTVFDSITEGKTALTGKIRSAVLSSYLKQISLVEKSEFETYLSRFMEANDHEVFDQYWTDYLRYQKQKEVPITETTGSLITAKDSLELDYQTMMQGEVGKVVLVDFWASWCAPCRKEMPAVHKLKESIDPSNFTVISISIDKDFTAWKKASEIEQLDSGKHNYLITDWDNTSLKNKFDIRMIPRYILYDRDGRVIDDNAPRPSDPELKKLIVNNL